MARCLEARGADGHNHDGDVPCIVDAAHTLNLLVRVVQADMMAPFVALLLSEQHEDEDGVVGPKT